MFKADIRSYTKQALEKRGVEVHARRERLGDRADARHAQVGHGAQGAHARLGRRPAGEPDRAVARRRAQRGNRVPVGPDLSVDGHPEVFAVGDIAWITDKNTDEVLPQLGSVALQSGECAGENIARLVDGQGDRAVRLHRQGDDGDDRPRRRRRAVQGGRTMKGKSASLAWGAVHLALLSTGEDRAKAVVDWTWAGFAHERPGRISVDTDEAQRPR